MNVQRVSARSTAIAPSTSLPVAGDAERPHQQAVVERLGKRDDHTVAAAGRRRLNAPRGGIERIRSVGPTRSARLKSSFSGSPCSSRHSRLMTSVTERPNLQGPAHLQVRQDALLDPCRDRRRP